MKTLQALAEVCLESLQAMSYRSGHHSTSDDSSRYRTSEEMHLWRARDPAARFQRWLTSAGWWDDGREAALRKATRQNVNLALLSPLKSCFIATGCIELYFWKSLLSRSILRV